MTGEIIKRYADIAREHLSRDYGLVYLDCNHMLAIEATVTAMQRERDEAREALREQIGECFDDRCEMCMRHEAILARYEGGRK